MKSDPLRVLLVEDEPTSLHLMEEILHSRGHEVDACDDAETGWSSFVQHRHLLVILDRYLPGMDGLELCRRIRDTPDAEDTIILFVTGAERREALEDALEAGANDYVVKPVDDRVHVRLAIAERQVRKLRDRRRIERELEKGSLYDPVTGLPNRSLLLDRLDRAARRAARPANDHLFGILLIDVHGFREVNDVHGREAGDRVLAEVGARLSHCIRTTDTAARMVSDEFALLLDGMRDVSDPTRVAQRVHEALTRPFSVDGGEIALGAAIGIAISLTGYERSEDVVRDAQQALQRARAEGPGTSRLFDPVMHAQAVSRLRLETRLRRALDHDELILHFQPIISLVSGRIESFEALVRWQDPERGLVPPSEFIPIAEETGLVVPMGWWVMERALQHLAAWRQVLPEEKLSVAVNLSARHVAQGDILEAVADVLSRAGMTGADLHVEITETSLMRGLEEVERSLRRLKETGVQVHVDDFGTGYSSLAYLCRLPIDRLKVDRSFVSLMEESAENLEVVSTIIRLAHNLSMDVVAEGVETEEQLALLREMGCDMVQGYLFSRPVEGDAVVGLLRRFEPPTPVS
ncbi:MAG: EAL domain-containing protein [Gemmatimonadetes bacterium]|nr:EAL domain-containing protein [Gemmatimonadota bacterium]